MRIFGFSLKKPADQNSRANVLNRTETNMAYKGIRKFKSKNTHHEQKLDNDLCQAVVSWAGRTVYLRGQCPRNWRHCEIATSPNPIPM